MPHPNPGLVRKWLVRAAFAAAVILLAAGSLPMLVEHVVLPRILTRTDATGYRIAVSRFGSGGCTLHIAGPPDSPVASAAGTVRLDWTIGDLLQRRLDRMTIDGFLLNLTLPFPPDDSSRAAGTPPVHFSPGPLPVTVERIEVVNSIVSIRTRGKTYMLPVTVNGVLQDRAQAPDEDMLHYRVQLTLDDQVVENEVVYDHAKGKLSGRFLADIDLAAMGEKLSGWIGQETLLQGTAQLDARYGIAVSPFSLEMIEAELLLHGFLAGRNDLKLAAAAEEAKVTVSGTGAKLQLNGAGFSLQSPLRATVDVENSIVLASGEAAWQGVAEVQPLPGQDIAGQVVLDRTPLLRLRHSGTVREDRIEARLESEEGPGEQYVVRFKDNTVHVEKLEMQAQASYQPQGDGAGLNADMVFTGAGLQVDFPQGSVAVPRFDLRVAGRAPDPAAVKEAELSASLAVENGALDLIRQEIDLQGITFDLPFAWPEQKPSPAGTVAIEAIQMRQVRLGNFRGSIRQADGEFSLEGMVSSFLLPDSPVQLTGRARIPRQDNTFAEAALTIREGRMDVANLARLYPALESITGSGTLDVNGNIGFSPCGMQGDLSILMRDGNIAVPEAHLELDDVGFNLHFPALPGFTTDPAQKMRIGSLRSNKLVVDDLQTFFRVESPQSLYIEKIAGKWSGGRIFTSGFRLQKGKEELEVALFCDRVELARILSQFGLAEAEGEGRMSGRVPLVYADQKIFVDDGFLFTSPGETGTLKVRQSKHLTLGVPEDVPQFSPLHFAGAALGNFEYNWAKLNIISEEENLLLKLQIDGKPKEKLPYRFDAGSNVFVRLEEGASGGMDQPIKLDVNFRVPVNDLFRYQSKIMPILRNLK